MIKSFLERNRENIIIFFRIMAVTMMVLGGFIMIYEGYAMYKHPVKSNVECYNTLTGLVVPCPSFNSGIKNVTYNWSTLTYNWSTLDGLY